MLASVFVFASHPDAGSAGPSPSESIAQSPVADAPPALFLQNANRISLKVTNWGRTDAKGGFEQHGDASLYLGALFIGAITEDGEMHVSNSMPPNGEFRPATGPAGQFHVSYPDDPRGNRPGLGRDPDDDGDGRWDEDELNGLDDDADGRIDEDFQTIGDQMSVVAFRDDQVFVDGAVPLGIEVRQRIVQWSSAGLETFLGIEYRLKNVGSQHLRNLFLGYMADADVGPSSNTSFWTDDLGAIGEIDTVVWGPEPSSPPTTLSIPVVFEWDAPDNASTIRGGDTPEVLGFFVVDHPVDPAGLVAPARVGLTSARIAFATSPFPGTPRTDADYYDLLHAPVQIPTRGTKPDDYRMYFGTGPFARLDPGNSMTVVLGLVVGSSESDFRRRVVNAQIAYRGRFVDGDLNPLTGDHGRERNVLWTGGYPFDAPESNAAPSSPDIAAMFDTPAGNRTVRIEWNDRPETLPDPTGAVSFEGYQIWRVDGWDRRPLPDRPAPDQWRLLDTYRLHPADSLGAASPKYLDRVRSGPHRYEWTDTEAVTNGRLYYYAVTTLGHTWKWSSVAGRFYASDVPGPPSSAEPLLIMPAWPEGESCSQVRVVPNPYHGSAPWNLAASDCDPSGSRLAFTHLPRGWRRVDIYSLTGDRVFSGAPEDSRVVGTCETRAGEDPRGTFFWDLRNDRGDDVESGIYLYAVEGPADRCRGHFVIIR